MRRRGFTLLLYGSVFLSCMLLFFSGSYVNFILAYVFSFVFLFLYTIFSASKILEKIVQVTLYALIMVVQILLVTLVFSPLFESGGKQIEPPGLNTELLERLSEKAGAAILLYRLPATHEQKKIMLDKAAQINLEGSAYNLIELALKHSWQPNIMFCSQFVYTMLELAGLNYFKKRAACVKPTDFIELDYYRELQFVSKIVLDKGDDAFGEKNT